MTQSSTIQTGLNHSPPERLQMTVRGAVQGVGFRPYVYRLAAELQLNGWVANAPDGLHVEVEGEHLRIAEFRLRLVSEAPPLARVMSVEARLLPPVGYDRFEIRESEHKGSPSAVILPDVATCSECFSELSDPYNRRYRYPFINCTHCGPRYSIITSLPYDRPNTTMAAFKMCPQCLEEYHEPTDRRFHAQPIACPRCGPFVELWDGKGKILARGEEALVEIVQALRAGHIVAVKGLGGFHLMADACSSTEVHKLRKRKHRGIKPFAVMFPSLEWLRRTCESSLLETQLLTSPESPIVLLKRRSCTEVSAEVAPGNPYIGALLPYTPLHHLLSGDFGRPVVATSGNLSDEPICTDEFEALKRLEGIADLFLVHNRPIARHVDDSIVRVTLGREQVLRRARGMAPLPLPIAPTGKPIIAFGGHLKNAIALSTQSGVVVSQHIGDLDTRPALEAFDRVREDLAALYHTIPEVVVCDLHPDYSSTHRAEECGLPMVRVQHHLAHVFSCAAENEIEPPYLGVAWDGTGYGSDGTIWGGEFFTVEPGRVTRIVRLRPIPLIGGDAAAMEPRRSALGVLWEMMGEEALTSKLLPVATGFNPHELEGFGGMLRRGVNITTASSVGRLFDAIGSLLGLCQINRFEGEAAMAVEFAATGYRADSSCPMPLTQIPYISGSGETMLIRGKDAQMPDLTTPGPRYQLDWEPLIKSLVTDIVTGGDIHLLAARFHESLAVAICEVAGLIGFRDVVLSGGCFLNQVLTERASRLLTQGGFAPHVHQRVPPGDGGIALGQIAAWSFISKGG